MNDFFEKAQEVFCWHQWYDYCPAFVGMRAKEQYCLCCGKWRKKHNRKINLISILGTLFRIDIITILLAHNEEDRKRVMQLETCIQDALCTIPNCIYPDPAKIILEDGLYRRTNE